ncbi:MAG: phage holin [bacterium]
MNKNPFLSNRTYDIAKWVAQIFLPALGALVFGLGKVYDWSWAAEVVGTITVVDIFLGAILGVSTKKYNEKFEGTFLVNEEATGDESPFVLQLDATPEELAQQSRITFAVKKAA